MITPERIKELAKEVIFTVESAGYADHTRSKYDQLATALFYVLVQEERALYQPNQTENK